MRSTCWLLSLTLIVLAGGCTSRKKAASNENFKQAINAYFYNGRDECLFQTAPYKFPAEVKLSEKGDLKTLDPLAKAGLLTRTEDGAFKLVRYAITPLGTRATPRFCYGHRDVTAVDSFTPPRVVEGRQASDVTYRYKMQDTPEWASDPGIKKEFPELARKTADTAEGKTTVMSAYAGWEVPDYGKPVIE